MEAGTSWSEIADQRIWVSQVGGDGSSFDGSVGAEHRLATTTIPGKDGDVTLKIGEGGLMGDPLMVALFWVEFLPSTIRWQHV